jgi:invasion protein IalB
MKPAGSASKLRSLIGAAIGLALAATGATGQDRPTVSQPGVALLPNGATAINEIYGDWTVDCRLADGQKRCILVQSQGNNRTGQRVFGIEIQPFKDGKSGATILMPFGLKLEAGAILKLDEKDFGPGLRFSTCGAQGCLLPISFPSSAVEAMKKGKTLTAASLDISSGEAVTFNISLNGFPAAFARLSELAK